MSIWLERQISSHNLQLCAVALIAGAFTTGVIYGGQAIRREKKIEKLKASIPDLDNVHRADALNAFGTASLTPVAEREDDRVAVLARRAREGDYDVELISEQLTRTTSFLGSERAALLRSSFVIIVGVGGVGSHCASALIRSGVAQLRLIDFDQVTLSSLNRHAVATLADVGTPKVDCVRKRAQAISPWVEWECINEVWRVSSAGRLLGAWADGSGRRPDYVVDAIDNIDSKVALLEYCHKQAINVISSMGAACKSDPTRICVGDISASIEDPLSRVTRRRLRSLGISQGIPVVFSTEKPGPGKAQLLPLPEEEHHKGGIEELSILPNFRARILPVLGTMPAVFGYTVANFVLMELTAYPHETGQVKSREKLYDQVLSNLQCLEERLVRDGGDDATGLKIAITKEDVGYLLEEVYRGRSVVSGLSTRLALVRWRRPKGKLNAMTGVAGQKTANITIKDLVCMTKEEVGVHEKEVLRGGKQLAAVYSSSVINLVEQRMEDEMYYSRYR